MCVNTELVLLANYLGCFSFFFFFFKCSHFLRKKKIYRFSIVQKVLHTLSSLQMLDTEARQANADPKKSRSRKDQKRSRNLSKGTTSVRMFGRTHTRLWKTVRIFHRTF